MEFVFGPGIDALLGREPAAAGGCDAEAEVVEVFALVGVAVDGEEAAGLDGGVDVRVAEVEAHPVGVDFEGDVVLLCRGVEGVHVGREAGAAVDEAAGGVAEDVDERVPDGAEEAAGGALGVLRQGDVCGGDDDVELGEQFVVVVEVAVVEDVDLAAGEDGDVLVLFRGGADGLDVVFEAVGGEAVGDDAAFAVVGDGDGVHAAALGFFGEFVDGEAAVGGGGVGVEVGPDVGEFDEAGCVREGEFAAVLADFGGDVGEAEGLVDAFFIGAARGLTLRW